MMQVEITNIIDESNRVKRFELASVGGDVIDFIPGQFVQITHPNLPAFQNTRSYSIASHKTKSNTIELCIALNEKGIFTPWLFEQKVGNKLEISQPQGGFVLKEEHLSFPLIFICTGTGIAPFRSMIYTALENGNEHVFLIFGNRKIADVLYANEFKSLALQYPRFHFTSVLSQEPDFENSGYVHPYYSKILRDIGDARIFVCGWKEMCNETRNNLKDLGYNRRQYFFEHYD